jgi:hypothetical protein
VGSGGKTDDPLWKVTPNMKCEIDFIRRQRGVFIQRKDGVCFDQIQRPVLNHPENLQGLEVCFLSSSAFPYFFLFQIKNWKKKERKI